MLNKNDHSPDLPPRTRKLFSFDTLSAFLTFSDRIEDLHCAAALMLTCVTIVYLVPATILTLRLLAAQDDWERSELREMAPPQRSASGGRCLNQELLMSFPMSIAYFNAAPVQNEKDLAEVMSALANRPTGRCFADSAWRPGRGALESTTEKDLRIRDSCE